MLREARTDDIVILTLDQPTRRNALSKALRDELTAAFERLNKDDAVRSIILASVGPAFCSGGDLSEMHVANAEESEARVRSIHHMVRAITGSAKLVIAAVEGWATGAGLSLALLCDTILASQAACFMASFGKVGLIGDLGALYTLPARIGEAAARQLLLYARPVNGKGALRIGLIDQLVPDGCALDAAIKYAMEARAVAPLAIAMTKSVLREGLERVLANELEILVKLYLSADHAEGKQAFLEKRSASFLNR